MSKEKQIKTCPFCGTICEGNKFINLICKCGAKYYVQSDIWLDRKKTKKKSREICGGNHSMKREKQIDEMANDLYENRPYKDLWLEDAKEVAEVLYNAGYRKQEWISVEERLPEEDGWYITYTNANGKNKGVIAQQLVTVTIRENKIRRWEWQTRVSPWIVTHWMPLPEAPKMKGGAE